MLTATVLALVLAQPANPWLAEAKALTAELRFNEALERLDLARSVPGMTPAQRHELFELRGRCLVAVGKREAAVDDFASLLREDPTWEPEREKTPPKVLEVFDDAKTRVYPADFVQLELLPGPIGEVSVKVVDPWHRVAQLFRLVRVNDAPWDEVEVVRANGLAAFPLVVPARARVSWYLEARDSGGAVVAHVGTQQEPRLASTMEVDVTAQTLKDTAGPRRITGWVVLGVGVLSVIAGAVLQINGWGLRLAARDPTRPPGDWADTALAAEASGLLQTSLAVGFLIGGGAFGLTGAGLIAW